MGLGRRAGAACKMSLPPIFRLALAAGRTDSSTGSLGAAALDCFSIIDDVLLPASTTTSKANASERLVVVQQHKHALKYAVACALAMRQGLCSVYPEVR